MGMTIQQFIDTMGGANKFDQIYVKDKKGNFVTAKGDVVFDTVTVHNSKHQDLEFVI